MKLLAAQFCRSKFYSFNFDGPSASLNLPTEHFFQLKKVTFVKIVLEPRDCCDKGD